MLSNTLLKYVLAVAIILLLMAITVKYMLDDNAKWRDISSEGLHTKIQTGITQIYWQWQAQGRAKQIEYWPQNTEHGFTITMSDKGLPLVLPSKEGCLEFLIWFVDEKILNKSLKVTITYVGKNLIDNDGRITGTIMQDKQSDFALSTCKFEYAGKIHTYNINSGQLTLTN